MPASFEIDHERRLVRSRAWGVLADGDLMRTQAGVREDPRFAPDYSQVFDFSEVSDVRVTREGLLALAARTPYGPTSRRAMVVPHDLGYGMARMYQMLSGRDPNFFRVFRSMDAALRWLDQAAGTPGPEPGLSHAP